MKPWWGRAQCCCPQRCHSGCTSGHNKLMKMTGDIQPKTLYRATKIDSKFLPQAEGTWSHLETLVLHDYFVPIILLVGGVPYMGPAFVPPTSTATAKSIKSWFIVQSICFHTVLSHHRFGYKASQFPVISHNMFANFINLDKIRLNLFGNQSSCTMQMPINLGLKTM